MKLDDIKRSKVGQLPANANILAGCAGKVAELESDSSNAALGSLQVQERVSSKFLVRITSFRKRLLDEDNLCEKFHTDLCRYSSVLPSDAPGRAKIEVSQAKVGGAHKEFTRIEIYVI